MANEFYRLSPPQQAPRADIVMPGSKSYTNRALILASLADGKVILNSPSHSDDSRVLCEALTSLGVRIENSAESVTVHGTSRKFSAYKGEIDVGPAGTSMRFLAALISFIPGTEVLLKGSQRMHSRPISDLVNALRSLGANIEYRGNSGCPPLFIRGTSSQASSEVAMNGSVSSQYFSALLLTAPLLKDGLSLNVIGEQISKSYIDMTLSSLRAFGIEVSNRDYQTYKIRAGQKPQNVAYQIEGDASGASYFWGIAAISGGTVRVINIDPKSAQGDARFPELLSRMGCQVRDGYDSSGRAWIEVAGSRSLSGVDADMELMPDTAQTLAVIAAVAKSPTLIRGLSTLRIKETDRLLALQTELAKLGVKSEIGPDFIKVIPGAIHPARIATYDDHRMAMSFAMLGSKIEGIEILEPSVVTKSFPSFWQEVEKIGIYLNR